LFEIIVVVGATVAAAMIGPDRLDDRRIVLEGPTPGRDCKIFLTERCLFIFIARGTCNECLRSSG
jgi:hypothetical protein